MKINDRILTVWWLFIVAICVAYTVWQLIYSEFYYFCSSLSASLSISLSFDFYRFGSTVIKLCNSHGFRFFDCFFFLTWTEKKNHLIYRLHTRRVFLDTALFLYCFIYLCLFDILTSSSPAATLFSLLSFNSYFLFFFWVDEKKNFAFVVWWYVMLVFRYQCMQI